jgi:hypothetical protein
MVELKRRSWVAAGAVLAVLCTAPPPADAAREIPVGLAYVGNTTLQSRDRLVATRFVLDRPTRIYRWWDNMDLGGADPPAVANGTGYALGDGGRMRLRITTVKRDGTPNLRRVLASESVNATRRNNQARRLNRIANPSDLAYFNLRGVRLRANRMYAAVFDNVARRPSRNFYSKNFPLMNLADGGPNARNTLDPDAPGAVAGLDPREVVMRSFDRGRSWTFARYDADDPDSTMQVPWYGWQSCARCVPQSNQPYYAYGQYGSYNLVAHDAPHAVTLTRAGGYAPANSAVGVVTVRNLTTGESASTPPLGSGIATGPLDRPLRIDAGTDFEISSPGTVFKAECDTFIYRTFRVGTLPRSAGGWPFETLGDNGCDRAELFALPWPWFAADPGRAAEAWLQWPPEALRELRVIR